MLSFIKDTILVAKWWLTGLEGRMLAWFAAVEGRPSVARKVLRAAGRDRKRLLDRLA